MCDELEKYRVRDKGTLQVLRKTEKTDRVTERWRDRVTERDFLRNLES